MNKKTNGTMALLSVLSIIVAFAAACFLCIYSLDAFGIITVDWSPDSNNQSQTDPAGDSVDTDKSSVSSLDGGKLRSILENAPFSDNYYLEMYIGIYSDGARYSTEACRIWRSGDKYRVIRYDEHMTAHRSTVCDGKSVKVTDLDTDTSAVYPISDIFSFEFVSGMPDFTVFKTEKYEISSYEYADGVYTLICNFPELETTDEIHIDASTGAVIYYKSSLAGTRIVECSVNRYDPDYDFSDVSFSLTSN